MTSVMDDVAGHLAFVAYGRKPWDGATVSIKVDLLAPVEVGAKLLVEGTVVSRERKKVFVKAVLRDGEEGGKIYAKMEGISIQPVKMSSIDDAVDQRAWMSNEAGPMLDSGWRLPLSSKM